MSHKFRSGLLGIFWIASSASFPLPFALAEGPALVINEIAWMGTKASANDEWIELFNPSDSALDLTNWRLQATDSSLNISLSGSISAQGFFVLERTSDNTISSLVAQKIYTGALKNSGIGLRLVDASGTTIDEVASWFAGSNTQKTTMERRDPTQAGNSADSWCTNDQVRINDLDSKGQPILGTPGQKNSCLVEVDKDAPKPPLPPPETALQTIIINEVMGQGSEVNPGKDDWIELYNPGDSEVLLTNWKIKGITPSGDFITLTDEPNRAIQPHDYFLISHYGNSSSSALGISPQLTKTSLVLPDDQPLVLELRDDQDRLMDRVSYTLPQGSDSYRSVERNLPVTDGTLAESWTLATARQNLKTTVTQTFATPRAPNSLVPLTGEVTTLISSYTANTLHLEWQNPTDAQLDYINVYKINEDRSGWNRLGAVIPPDASYTLTLSDPTLESEFRLTTVDRWGRESAGIEITFAPLPPIVINEVLPRAKTKDGENEFIELWNRGPSPINLSEWELDDDNTEDDHSYFFTDAGKNYTINPDGYLMLYSNETNFTLGNDGDSVQLSDPNGYLVDAIFFMPPEKGRSYGRNATQPDQLTHFYHPTPGAQNIEVNRPPLAVIREQGGTGGMTINPTGEDSSDPDGDVMSYFWTFEEGATSPLKNPLAYTFSSLGPKTITLTVTDEFGLSTTTDHSFISTPVGSSRQSSGEETSTATQTAPQSSATAPTPLVTTPPSLLSEIMPNPAGSDTLSEWVELYNPGDTPVDLGGWYLDDAEGGSAPVKIPQGFTLRPQGFYRWGAPDVRLTLKNTSDTIRLLTPQKQVFESVGYTEAKEGSSYAKRTNGTWAWTPVATPEAPNQFPDQRPWDPSQRLRIKSVLPNPQGKDTGREKITLSNAESEAISLKGWCLQNDSRKNYCFGEGLAIAPQQDFVVFQKEFGFTLKNTSGSVSLLNPLGSLIDSLTWNSVDEKQVVLHPLDVTQIAGVKVVRVIDGDTFEILWEGKLTKVRLIGVDTPETLDPRKPVQKYGQEAVKHLKRLLEGQIVTLKFDRNPWDKYSRLLAYVYKGSDFINAGIIQNGYGYVYTHFPFEHLAEFVALQKQAEEAHLGLWQNAEISALVHELIAASAKAEEPAFEEPVKPEKKPVKKEKKKPNPSLPDKGDLEGLQSLPSKEFCLSNDLKIDRFLPNAQKGKTVEYIQLINQGKESVCLAGWSIDDEMGKGSKAFRIKEGEIAPSATRAWRQTETGLRLNDSNDCVTLIDPQGRIKDQICYQKTHKNEQFTHAGGDYKKATVVRKKSKKEALASRTGVDSSRPFGINISSSITNDSDSLQPQTLDGTLVSLDSDKNEAVIQTREGINELFKIDPKYFDATLVAQLLKPNTSITLSYRGQGSDRFLTALSPQEESQTGLLKAAVPSYSVLNKIPPEAGYGLLGISVVGSLWLMRKRF